MVLTYSKYAVGLGAKDPFVNLKENKFQGLQTGKR